MKIGRLVLAVPAHGVEILLAHHHPRRREHLAARERAHRRLDPRRRVLEREQHVVGHRLVQALVQRANLHGVGVRQRLLHEQHHVVGLGGVSHASILASPSGQ